MSGQKPPDPPAVYLAFGILTALLGAVGLLTVGLRGGPGTIAALALVWLGSILALIGVVGIGVTIGMRRADYLIRVKGN